MDEMMKFLGKLIPVLFGTFLAAILGTATLLVVIAFVVLWNWAF